MTKERARHLYDEATRAYNAAEPVKAQYPRDWLLIVAQFERTKRDYEKSLTR